MRKREACLNLSQKSVPVNIAHSGFFNCRKDLGPHDASWSIYNFFLKTKWGPVMKELKQRRLRRERELQKSSRFRLAKPATRFFGESA